MKPVPPTFGINLPEGFLQGVVGQPRRYPSFPEPEPDLEQLADVSLRLKEAVEILLRDRGDVLDSSVKVRDLPSVADYVLNVITPVLEGIVAGSEPSFTAMDQTISPKTYNFTNTAIKLVDLWDSVFNDRPTRIEGDIANSQININQRARLVRFHAHFTIEALANEDLQFQLRRNDVETIWDTIIAGAGAGRPTDANLIGISGPAIEEGENLSIWVRSLDPTASVEFFDSAFIAEWVPFPYRLGG